MSELVAKMAATDGFSFNRITHSNFIRQIMSARGFLLPRNPSDVRKLMMDFYDSKKYEVMQKIKQHKSEKKN
jgi:phosphohistidine phosphatase SixA